MLELEREDGYGQMSKYVGQVQVKHNVPEGWGTSYFSNGNKEYEGHWKDGFWSGQGTLYWNNGSKRIEGFFRWSEDISDSVIHGKVIEYDFDGKKCFEGIYENGEIKGQTSAQYYYGDGLGSNNYVTLYKFGRIDYEEHGCLGLYGRKIGAFKNNKNDIAVQFRYFQFDHKAKPESITFHKIKWGLREYLISEKRMIDFCNSINSGEEPRDDCHGSFYLKLDDEEKKVTGFPEIPKKWNGYLLKKPIVGKITKVFNKLSGVANVGEADGLKKGMTLFTPGEYYDLELVITEVEKNKCKFKISWDDDSEVVLNHRVSTKSD